MVVPCAATDDDKPSSAPEAVEVLAPEDIPVVLNVPTVLDSPVIETDDEMPSCQKSTRDRQREAIQYSLIVGLAMDLPYDINIPIALGAATGVYLECKIKRARANRRAEQH